MEQSVLERCSVAFGNIEYVAREPALAKAAALEKCAHFSMFYVRLFLSVMSWKVRKSCK